MVNIGNKPDSERWAVARGQIIMQADVLAQIKQGNIKKGDVLSMARVAGIMAAKHTDDLIPLCHPLQLTHIDIQFQFSDVLPGVMIEATVRTRGKTGVEMEALTAVSTAALTIYDMAKALDHSMRIEGIRLAEKHGGQSGDIILE